jgi:hypothetical protein
MLGIHPGAVAHIPLRDSFWAVKFPLITASSVISALDRYKFTARRFVGAKEASMGKLVDSRFDSQSRW